MSLILFTAQFIPVVICSRPSVCLTLINEVPKDKRCNSAGLVTKCLFLPLSETLLCRKYGTPLQSLLVCSPLGALWQVNYLSSEPSRWIVIRLCLYKNIPSLESPSQSDLTEACGIHGCDVLLSPFSGMGSGRGNEVPQVFMNILKPPNFPAIIYWPQKDSHRFHVIYCPLLDSNLKSSPGVSREWYG